MINVILSRAKNPDVENHREESKDKNQKTKKPRIKIERKNMGAATGAVNVLLIGIMLIYAVLVVLVLIRAVVGPKVADRLMAINMIGTVGIFLMAVVAVKLGEDYLLDISIIYAMISFISVVILTKVYMGVHEENIMRNRQMKEKEASVKAKSVEEESGVLPDKPLSDEDELDRLLREMEK